MGNGLEQWRASIGLFNSKCIIKQRVRVNVSMVGLKSCFICLKSIFAGVPQGSVLGPLLFLVYINDIAEHLLSLTRLFADDSSLFYSAAHIDDIAGIINHDMQLLSNWARQWLVTFNPLKLKLFYLLLKRLISYRNLFLIIFQLIS